MGFYIKPTIPTSPKKVGKRKSRPKPEKKVEEAKPPIIPDELSVIAQESDSAPPQEITPEPNCWYWADYGRLEIILVDGTGKYFYQHGVDMAWPIGTARLLKKIEKYQHERK